MSGEIIGVSALRDILPCRPSMLLLDRVFAESENKLIGLKSISMNEPCFMGHFPGHPILPGVLQVEAIAQLAEVGLWKRLDPERKGDFYIKELHKIKFRRPNGQCGIQSHGQEQFRRRMQCERNRRNPPEDHGGGTDHAV